MIYQMKQNEHTQNQFSNAIKELQIGNLLRKSNITKSCGIPAYEVFSFCCCWYFRGKIFSVSSIPSTRSRRFQEYLLSFPE